MKRLIPIYILLIPLLAQAQQKEEYEKRISRDKFPTSALEFLEPFMEDARQMRYFYEIDGEHKSYEAKFKLHREKYSVEFDQKGVLEDIEIDGKLKDIDEEPAQMIENWLDDHYDKWRIEEFQFQFLPDDNPADFPLEKLKNNFRPSNFELIILIKHKGKVKTYEMLFSSDGKFVRSREVVRGSHDFILF